MMTKLHVKKKRAMLDNENDNIFKIMELSGRDFKQLCHKNSRKKKGKIVNFSREQKL